MVDWKETVNHLYANIKPLSGVFYYIHEVKEETPQRLSRFWAELKLENFKYYDPLYEESEVSNNFDTIIEFDDLLGTLQNIKEIEDKEFFPDINKDVCSFSNSISFSVPYCKFGKIVNNQINVELEYILTNGNYGSMTETFEVHKELKGKMSVQLNLRGLIELREEHLKLDNQKLIDTKTYRLNKLQTSIGLPFGARKYEDYYDLEFI
jgi:tRNA splicing ligase